MFSTGEEGYIAMARRIHGGVVRLSNAIESTPGLKVIAISFLISLLIFDDDLDFYDDDDDDDDMT